MFHARRTTDYACPGTADTENRGQRDIGVLVIRYVDSAYPGHALSPK
jgi:hypothetical protein